MLTDAQSAILAGLALWGHAYVSATEAPEKDALGSSGLVEVWMAMGGFLAWRITEAGRVALAEQAGGECG